MSYHSWVKLKYDNRGNCVEKETVSDINSNTRETYKYDNRGNKIDIKQYYGNGSLIVHVSYEYDNNGNKIKTTTYDSNDILYRQETHKYDNLGNIIEINHTTPANNNYTISYKYKYDKKGNWKIRAQYILGNVKDVILRDFQYYD